MPDNRVLAVQVFLDSYRCGSETEDFDTATTFVMAADANKIDYRILPIIYLKESTCGKNEIPGTYNGFGFANGVTKFSSFTDAVNTISLKLTEHPYAGKNLHGVISTYNNHPEYWTTFEGFYAQITKDQQSFDLRVPMVTAGVIQR